MPDREKVIKALSCKAFDDDVSCADCAYFRPNEKPVRKCDYNQIFDDAIELLKEQEAVKPTWSRGKPYCGACGLRIHGGKFCGECGKPIAWEGR